MQPSLSPRPSEGTASASDRTGRSIAFDAPFHHLAALPRGLWLPALVTPIGDPRSRLCDTALWRAALLTGELPSLAADFADTPVLAPMRQAIAELGLPALCKGVPPLAEQVLRTLLWHLGRALDLQPRLSRADAITQVTAEFRQAWQLERAGLEEQLTLLRELAAGSHLQWDDLRGQLRSGEWQAARRAAQRLAALPELVTLLQQLGRSPPRPAPHASPALAPPQPPRADEPPPERSAWRAVQTVMEGAPGELIGIRQAASVQHMLASEAALLMHPVGRRLWRAKHAEGRLLAHDTRATWVDWLPDPHGAARAAARRVLPRERERGPMVLCLDTSGSMRGAPENVAKAVVIAALQAAQASGRACKLIAFGGAGELLERDLMGPEDSLGSREAIAPTDPQSPTDAKTHGRTITPTDEGQYSEQAASALQAKQTPQTVQLAHVLELMGQSFDGGTDVQTPIERAVDRLHEAAWASADIVLVTDGEFGCQPATLARLAQARHNLGAKVQGILVGDRETLGLLDVCDAIHWVRDWRRYADEGEAGERAASVPKSPVHSKSLTALYFPNALSAHAARHHPARTAPAAPTPSFEKEATTSTPPFEKGATASTPPFEKGGLGGI
jgi:uncharacterized protein with von Willebrand factor type A (vWA) domain